ncbi:hypothetical protein M2336_001659 [Sphingobium sp. B1D7B]|uniref:hypothetical protein n=1 Tax=Sphingobium sp. B1D7B TaxID=2940578 RepID=UPI002225895E|nr:hypothetical protein [Sphingobium sp. B1D7B]MCW2405030.1 hypothetical protein [Sphingobium sp. B1D7B]
MPQARDEAGNIWEVDAQGNAVRLVSPGGSAAVGSVLSDPNAPLDAAVKQNQIANSNADNARADAAAARDATRMNAELYSKGLRIGANGQPEPIPGWVPPASIANKPTMTAKERADALQGYKDADAIDRVVADLRRRYTTGPGATKGISSLSDYLPTDSNRTFNDAGQRARGYVKRSLGFTGGEGNTLGESTMLYNPYLPEAGDRDVQILAKIDALEQLGRDARDKSISILGGIPDANGNIKPIEGDSSLPGANRFSGGGGSITNSPVGPAAPAGSTTKALDIPPAMQAELNQYLAGVPRGQLQEAQFRDVLAHLNEKYGVGSGAQDVSNWVRYYNEQRGPINATIPGTEVPMSSVDQIRNNAINNPAGAAAAGYLNTAGFGIPQALAPTQTEALSNEQALPFALGQVGGALTGTSLLAGAGRNTIGRLAPRTLGGGARGMFGRNLATDAAFGGIYGGVTEGDPLTGAVAGTVGSAAGQGIGAGVGKALTGGGSAAANYLRGRGIPLTAGQALGGSGRFGNMVKGIEDRLSGVPIIGDMVNARRLEGLRAFNEQALGEVAGGQVPAIGAPGIDDLRPRVSSMYDQATAGVTVPVGPNLASDIGNAKALGASLPPDLASRFSTAMTNRVDPVIASGQMTGDQFQQVQRALKGYRAEAPKAGFEQDYRDALSAVSDALDGNMRTQGGQSVISGLDAANRSYRDLKVLEDAVTRARNGSRSGEVGVFTPSQLNDASAASARKFGGGQATTNRPFYELGSAGQDVLPSAVPDSGTTGRLATFALPAALGGGGLGVDSLFGTDNAAQSGLGLGLLLTIAGTKKGQEALVKAIMDRPASVRTLGSKIGKRQGMFGSAAAPFAIEQAAP